MDQDTINIVDKLKEFKKAIQKEYGVEKVIFFGSRASGNYREDSDIDLIIVGNKFRGEPSLKRPRGLHSYFDLKNAIDFICYTPEEFQQLSGKISLVKQAIEEGLEI